MKIYQEEIYNLQTAALGQHINDSMDYFTILMDDEKTFKTRHAEVFSNLPTYLDRVPPWKEWIYSDKATDNCAFTVVLFVEPHRMMDIKMVKSWLEAVQTTDRKLRLKVIPRGKVSSNTEILWKLNKKAIGIEEALKELKLSEVDDTNDKVLERWINENEVLFPSISTASGPIVSINGHLYGPFNTNVDSSTINVWLQVEWHMRTELLQLLRLNFELERDPTALSQMTMFTGHLSTLLKKHRHLFTGSQVMDIPIDKVNHFEVEREDALLQVKVLLNPFSVSAAKVSAILLVLMIALKVIHFRN